jgi:hypothetical protein
MLIFLCKDVENRVFIIENEHYVKIFDYLNKLKPLLTRFEFQNNILGLINNFESFFMNKSSYKFTNELIQSFVKTNLYEPLNTLSNSDEYSKRMLLYFNLKVFYENLSANFDLGLLQSSETGVMINLFDFKHSNAKNWCVQLFESSYVKSPFRIDYNQQSYNGMESVVDVYFDLIKDNKQVYYLFTCSCHGIMKLNLLQQLDHFKQTNQVIYPVSIYHCNSKQQEEKEDEDIKRKQHFNQMFGNFNKLFTFLHPSCKTCFIHSSEVFNHGASSQFI